MIIASTDLETTGLDPSYCQVLEVGVVLWDTTDFSTPVEDLPAFHCYVTHERVTGQAFALQMNQRILERIAKREKGYDYLEPGDVGRWLTSFVADNFPHLIERPDGGFLANLSPTGFNFDSFDRQFLTRLPEFNDSVRFAHRSLAPATLFFDPLTDAKLPGSDEVFKRAGVTVSPDDRHTALGDARAVIEVLRAGYKRAGGHGGHGGGTPAPHGPRCPECGDRKTLRVPGGHGDYDTVSCHVCDPRDMFGRALLPADLGVDLFVPQPCFSNN